MNELTQKYGPGVATLLRARGIDPEGLVEQILQDATVQVGDAPQERSICAAIIRLIGQLPARPGVGASGRTGLATQVEEVLSGMPEHLQREIVRYAIGGLDDGADLSQAARDAWCRQFDREGQRRPSRALVVDDDPVNRKFVGTILQGAGWEVQMAASADEALELANTERFDFMVMDYKLPGANGAEVVKAIRAGIGPSSGAYILGASVAEVRRECLEAGMDEYFQKPIDVNTLRNRAETVAAASAEWQVSESGVGPGDHLRGLEEYRERLQRIVTAFGS